MRSDLVELPDGRVLEILQLGDPTGTPVFFLPGCPDSRWAALPGDEPARRAGVRLISLNRPGYGRSTPVPSSAQSVADDLVATADRLVAGAFAVLGMSVGGVYALACAVRHPDRVLAVTTCSAPGNVAAMAPPHHRDELSAADAELLAAIRSTDRERAMALLSPPFLDFVASAHRGEHDDEALDCADGYLNDASMMLRPWSFDVSSIRCPIVVRHGELDTAASPRNAHWLAEHVPGARLVLTPDEDHLETLHGHWEEVLGELADQRGGEGAR